MIVITKDKLNHKPEPEGPREKLIIKLDVTGLTRTEVAESLLQLAATLDNPEDEDAAEALRRKVAERDPTLTTTTRLERKRPEPLVVLGPSDRVLGSAVWFEEEPLPPPPPPRTRRSSGLFANLPGSPWDDEDEDDDEDDTLADGDWDDTFVDGDPVEFWRRDEWFEGIIVAQTGPWTYEVEDARGDHWECNVKGLRGSADEEELKW